MSKEKTHIKWYKKRFAWYAYLLLLIFPLTELGARILGETPYQTKPFTIVSSPSRCLVADSLLGISLSPGSFEIVMNKEHSYTATHFENGRRRVIRTNTTGADSIYLMGCSFTYGMGVDDHETFASLLQKHFPNVCFENFGVPGYGTVQSFLQLQKCIESGSRPKAVVLQLSHLHFSRNSMTAAFRHDLKIGFSNAIPEWRNEMKKAKFPYCKNPPDSKIHYVSWDSLYDDWWGREYSAFINMMNNKSDLAFNEKIECLKITQILIERMVSLCEMHGIEFYLTFLDESNRMGKIKDFCDQNKVNYVSVGLTHKDEKYTNLPYDNHPNALGHIRISDSLHPLIRDLIIGD
jgi:hypothetical protein